MPRPTQDPKPGDFLPLSPPALHLLLALAAGELHGWAILKEIEEASDGRVRLSAGTLYGLIKRLLARGLIAESDRRPPRRWDDERRRYYRLTDLGRAVAEAEVTRLEETLAIAHATDLRGSEA